MAFAAEVNDFINAFGAMNKALGTRASREGERARTDYTRALTDKLRYDMGEGDRLNADVLHFADDRYGTFNSDEIYGGGGGDILGGINSGEPIVINGVTITGTGNLKGLDPHMQSILRGMAAGASRAGLDRLDITAGYEGGHKSHLSRNDLDVKGYAGNQLWNPEQRVGVARGGGAGGADRFGLYSFGEGYTGNGSLHIGRAGAVNPRTGERTPRAVWGYRGMTGGDASRAFSDPYERAFLRKFNAGDLAAAAGADTMMGGAGEDVMGGPSNRAYPSRSTHRGEVYSDLQGNRPVSAWRDAIASVESQGEADPYRAVGADTGGGNRALGRYQIMESNLPEWAPGVTAEQFLADPALQDRVFDVQFNKLMQRYGSPRDAISAWFTGRPEAEGANAQDVNGMRGSEYVNKVMAAVGGARTQPTAGGAISTTPFDELQTILSAGGDQPGFESFDTPEVTDARTKDDELNLDAIMSKPDSKIPWYNRGAFGSEVYDELAQIQSVAEGIATAPMAPTSPPGSPSALFQPLPPEVPQGPPTAAAGLAPGASVAPLGTPPLPPTGGIPAPIPYDVLAGGGRTGVPAPDATVDIPLPPERPDLPGTEPVSGTEVPTPPMRPEAEAVPTSFGVDPFPQTSGHTDPVSQAGHETLSAAITGTGNRHRFPFKDILRRADRAGRDMLGVPDEAVPIDDNDPRKEAHLTGVGGINAELLAAVEDRVSAAHPEMSEEEKKMEVVSTLWNYFAERGDYNKADKLAFAAMQSYKQISQRYSAIAQAAAEDGDMEAAVQNYIAAYASIPDGEVFDVQQNPDGTFTMSIREVDSDIVKQEKVVTPDELFSKIMDMSPEAFDHMIKKKVETVDEPTAAEIAAQEETAWLTGGGGVPTAGGAAGADMAIPEDVPTTDTGDDMLGVDEAVPTDTGEGASAHDITEEVNSAFAEVEQARGTPLTDNDREAILGNIVRSYSEAGGTSALSYNGVTVANAAEAAPTDEAIPEAPAEANVTPGVTTAVPGPTPAEAPAGPTPAPEVPEPPEPMSPEDFTYYLGTVPPGARDVALQIWKMQTEARNNWVKDQPTAQDLAIQQGVNKFFTDLASTPPGEVFFPDETLLLNVKPELGNLMMRAAEEHNKLRTAGMTEARQGIQESAFRTAVAPLGDQPDVIPSPVPTSSPIMPGRRTGTINPLGAVVPGQATPEQFRRTLNVAETPTRKVTPAFDTDLYATMDSTQRADYIKRRSELETSNKEFNTGFEPGAVDVSKIADPTGTGEPTSFSQIFIGSPEETVAAVDGGLGVGGMLGDFITHHGQEGMPDDSKAVASTLVKAIDKYPDMPGDVANAAAAIMQTNNGKGFRPEDAMDAVTNMLTVQASNPMRPLYSAAPIPNKPGMAVVHFYTTPEYEVEMPVDTYEMLDDYQSRIRADFINDARAAEVTQSGIDVEQGAAATAGDKELIEFGRTGAGMFGPIYPTE